MTEWIWPNMRQMLKAVVLLGTSAVVSACSHKSMIKIRNDIARCRSAVADCEIGEPVVIGAASVWRALDTNIQLAWSPNQQL